MQLALDVSDLAALSQPQKDAVLTSLFVALIADGEPSTEELAQFERSVAALPWGKDREQLQLLTRSTVDRLRTSNDDGKRAFMKELADAIPGAALREKVVFDMAAVMAADQVATGAERSTVGAFILAFGLDPQTVIEKIKARLPSVDRAATLGVKLEPADIAALDDSQKVAVLEALVTGVLADGKATQGELGWFQNVVARLPWGMEPPVLDATIKGVAQRIAALKNPAEITDFIVGLASRLPTQPLREKVLYTVATIMSAERDLNELEKNTLGALVLAFGITSDRLRIIKEAVTGRSTPPPPSSAT
jgi:hypothetical protein